MTKLYKVDEGLLESSLQTESFSQTQSSVHSHLVEAAKTLYFNLSYTQAEAGITDKEIEVVRDVFGKLYKCEEANCVFIRKQDLILRCLHPDGYWFSRLSKDVRVTAFKMMGSDPADSVAGLRLGRPSPDIDATYEFLNKQVHKAYTSY
jgi:hypothetical protein